MMLISNDQVLETFFYQFYRGTKSPQEVKAHILQDLMWLSIFRKINTANGWNINFNGISIADAYNPRKDKLELSTLISQINRVNRGIPEINRERLNQVSEECKKENGSVLYLNITQGHDFLFYFQRICQQVKKRTKKMAGVDEISRGLRCSFRMDDFQKTDLYQSILKYQNTYGRILLSA
jgi:hypothetical protein